MDLISSYNEKKKMKIIDRPELERAGSSFDLDNKKSQSEDSWKERMNTLKGRCENGF